ncbi:MAG: zinc-ribbon domain-containing protein, partial [Planctomycetaceae bacterium]|nr:zinc-ribbon domain-containing protein [Planctomycetaceae bacterium]
MSETGTCPKCGNELPENAPSGICPKCLMQA